MRRAFVNLLKLGVLAGVALPALAALAERRVRPRPDAFDPTDDLLDVAAIFEGAALRSEADAFEGGELLVWFGGLRLDLSDARLDPEGARLELRCLFGGLDLVVPRDCRVEVRARGYLGAIGDTTGAPLDERDDLEPPLLVLEGWTALGGVGIRRADA